VGNSARTLARAASAGVRVRDRRAERAFQRTRATPVRQLATNGPGSRPAPSPLPRDADGGNSRDSKAGTFILHYQGTVAETETFTMSRERTSPDSGLEPTSQVEKRDKEQMCPLGTGTELSSLYKLYFCQLLGFFGRFLVV
jgi:hypothetical protein